MSSTMDSLVQQIGDGRDLKIQTSTGKIGLYGVTPVVQAAAITAPAATGSSNSSPYGFTGAAQADAIVTAVRAIITALKNAGITL